MCFLWSPQSHICFTTGNLSMCINHNSLPSTDTGLHGIMCLLAAFFSRVESAGEAPCAEVGAVSCAAAPPAARPPHTSQPSSCCHSLRSLGSKGRCRKPGRGGRMAAPRKERASLGQRSLYTPVKLKEPGKSCFVVWRRGFLGSRC